VNVACCAVPGGSGGGEGGSGGGEGGGGGWGGGGDAAGGGGDDAGGGGEDAGGGEEAAGGGEAAAAGGGDDAGGGGAGVAASQTKWRPGCWGAFLTLGATAPGARCGPWPRVRAGRWLLGMTGTATPGGQCCSAGSPWGLTTSRIANGP
jgi:hypothetical protein